MSDGAVASYRAVGLSRPTASRSPGKWAVLVAVGLGTFLTVLDSSIVNISLPVITSELHTDVTAVQWVVMAYLLTITGLLLSFGRMADLLGRKRIYVLGMGIFTATMALCGLAQTIEHLIALRALQGIGSAMVMALSPALTASAFPPGERGKALGINATIVAAGSVSGPILGGVLNDLASWRWVFFFRVPLCLVATFLAWRLLAGAPASGRQRVDLAGGALLFVWLAALTLGLNQGQGLGWGSPPILGAFATALLGLAAFVAVELRVGEPMFELALLRVRLFSAASASALLSFVATSAVTFLMPFYLIVALGQSQSSAGLMLIPQPLVMSVVAPLSGWLSDRIGSRVLATTGLGIACLALLSMSGLDAGSTYPDIALRLAALGVGIGLFGSPNSSALLSSVAPSRIGVASGMQASMRNLGMVVGTAVAGAVWTGRMAYHASGLAAAGVDEAAIALQSFVGGFRDAFVVAAALCSIGVFCSLVRGSQQKREPSPRPSANGRASRLFS